MKNVDVVIIGAGAAGLFCASQLGQGGKSVVVLDNGKKLGRKILMSGGGNCNFTNMDISSHHYLCQNPHFVKSALARYTQWDFISMVASYGITYHEKELGQLFCDKGAEQIVAMLKTECEKSGNANIQLRQAVTSLEKFANFYQIHTASETYQTPNIVIATGGLSMPALGATPFGYQVAKQFDIPILPPRASLVPFTYKEKDKVLVALSGIALPVTVTCGGQSF